MDLQNAKELCKNLPDLREFLFSREVFMSFVEADRKGLIYGWKFDAEPYLEDVHSSENYSFEASLGSSSVYLQLAFSNTPGGQYAHNDELENYIFNLAVAKNVQHGAFDFSDKNVAYDMFQYLKKHITKHDFSFKIVFKKEKKEDVLKELLSIENLPKELADYFSTSALCVNDEVQLWKNQVLEIVNADDEDCFTQVCFSCPWYEE